MTLKLSPRWLGLLLLVQLPWLGHQPLVRDEVYTQETARKTLPAMWHALQQLDAPMALYYLFLHAWTQVSDSRLWLRLPSLLAVVGAVVVTTYVAERLGGRRAGLVTGLLLVACPGTWTFGAIARPYGPALLAAAVTLAVVLLAPRRWVLLLVAAVLTLYLQGMFVLLLAGEAVLLWRGRERRSVAALAVAVVAWVPLAVLSSRETVMTSWIPHTSPFLLATSLHEMFGGTGVLSIIAVLAWAVLAAAARPSREQLRLLALAVVPAVFLAAAGLVLHVFGGRYLLYGLLVVAVVLGLSRSVAPPRAIHLVLAGLVVLTAGDAVYQARTPWHQDDLPSAAAFLAAHDQPGDALLYSPDHVRVDVLPQIEQLPQPAAARLEAQDVSADDSVDRTRLGSDFLPERSANSITQLLQGRQRIWVVAIPGDVWRPTPNTGGDLAARYLKGWTRAGRYDFGQLELQLYTSP